MEHYLIRPVDDDDADSYWIQAASADEARRLVALNVPGAKEARDTSKFECELSGEKQPPKGVIYTRINGTHTVSKR